MSKSSIKRRHVFIDKAFQGRFIIGVFLLILLSGLCSALVIYWLIGNDLQAQAYTAHVNILNAWDRLGVSIFVGNVIAIGVAGAVSVMLVIYASHKIAGPLFRFEKICEQIGEGQFDTITTLREHDQLQPLAVAFTGMVDKLQARKQQQKVYLDTLKSSVEALKNEGNLTDKQVDVLASLDNTLKKLKGCSL